MARPSTAPFPWATNAGRREVPTPGDQASGAVGGQPVPSLKNNGLLGNFSDWLRYWWTANDVVVIQPGLAYWSEFDASAGIEAAGVGTTLIQANGTIPALGAVRVYGGASSGGDAKAGFPLFHPMGGAVSSVEIEVFALTGTPDVIAYLIDGNGNVVVYEATVNATGTTVLSYDSGLSAGTGTASEVLSSWAGLYLRVQVAAGEEIEITKLTFNFS